MVNDEPPSKRCVSGQRFCLAAIYAKLIGIVTSVVAISPVGLGGREGRDRKSVRTFFKPGK
jgi:hypothetical protein